MTRPVLDGFESDSFPKRPAGAIFGPKNGARSAASRTGVDNGGATAHGAVDGGRTPP